MKKLCLLACISLSLANAVLAEETAAQWADKNKDTLATITDATLTATLEQGAPALGKLFGEIKTAGASDSVASVRIAALSQFVMRPEGAKHREAYTDALLAAAQRPSEEDVVCFFLSQLRWCGLPEQANAIRGFEKSGKPGIAALATMVVQAVTDDRASKAAPVKDTPCSALNQELAALAPEALTPRLLQLADDPNLALAGVAMCWARTAGGPKETALWAGKLAALKDPVRRVMILDMLGKRGDKASANAVAACLTEADDAVAAAAQQTLIALDAATFAAQIPTLLKDLSVARQALIRDGVRQLPTSLVKTALLKAYDGSNETGKKVLLEVLKDRRVSEAIPLGLAAIDSKDVETAIIGWRLLRAVAGREQAGTLLAKLLTAAGRATPEAQTTFAVAARRDSSGAYLDALLKTLQTAPDAQIPAAIETASHLGGEALRKAVETDLNSTNVEISIAAVRALADWPDASSVPALLRLAATGATAKQQVLAQRGLTKKLNQDGVDKKDTYRLWQSLKSQLADESRRKAIDDLFKQEINVALGKPVTTDVPTEGNHAPANLTDGTQEKAWHGAKSPARAAIDLGAVKMVTAAHITFYHEGNRTYTFLLELSEDGKTWKRVAGNTEDPKPATAEGLRMEFEPTPTRFARLAVLKNSANPAVHVLELKLLAPAMP